MNIEHCKTKEEEEKRIVLINCLLIKRSYVLTHRLNTLFIRV